MKGPLCWYLEDIEGSLEDRVILDVMDVLGRPQGSYPESFVLISLLEVCQEWGGPSWGYLEDIEGF